MFAAVFGNHSAIVRLMVNDNDDVDARMDDDFTPLIVAVQMCAADIVEILVESGANLESRIIDGSNALYLAAFKGFGRIVEYLVGKFCFLSFSLLQS